MPPGPVYRGVVDQQKARVLACGCTLRDSGFELNTPSTVLLVGKSCTAVATQMPHARVEAVFKYVHHAQNRDPKS